MHLHRSSKSTYFFRNKSSIVCGSMLFFWCIICLVWLKKSIISLFHHGRPYRVRVFFWVSASIFLNSLDNTRRYPRGLKNSHIELKVVLFPWQIKMAWRVPRRKIERNWSIEHQGAALLNRLPNSTSVSGNLLEIANTHLENTTFISDATEAHHQHLCEKVTQSEAAT